MDQSDDFEANEERTKKIKATLEVQSASPAECRNELEKPSKITEPEDINVNTKSQGDEIYYSIQGAVLALTTLALSYYSLIHGSLEYSLLENGQTVNGVVSPRKAVVTLSLGYSFGYSFISSVGAFMLLYSLVSMKPYWSLPTIVLCIAEIVWEVGDAIVAVWLLFARLKFTTAVIYTAAAAFVIIGEVWCWLGIVRLYELRSFG